METILLLLAASMLLIWCYTIEETTQSTNYQIRITSFGEDTDSTTSSDRAGKT